MKDKFIPILSVCTALFAILYAGYVYQVTQSISLVTIVLLIAGLAPVFNRENDLLNSLFTAITAVLIATPFAIFNISFHNF